MDQVRCSSQLHPDCNSNKCRVTSSSGTMDPTTSSDTDPDAVGSSQPSSCSGSVMHDSADYQWCLDYGYNREYHNLKKFPQSVLSFEQPSMVSSYDDVAKNIDANLAEIDMEDFRSEDIHSILALPAIYSGELERSRHHRGEKGASVSESLLGAFELDSSVSPRSTSEDGSTSMSICKDEPLFSPLREQHIPPLGTISTDSLDCGSSLVEPDLVLTCRANKNNYTIAFEGSGPQFSDDSDYFQEVEGSSGGDSGMWQEQASSDGGGETGSGGKGRDMIQSDCVFTTWSKLRRIKETTRTYGRKCKTGSGAKSQSLPNLLRQSVVAERAMESSWEKPSEKVGQNVCLPLFDIQNSQLTRSKDSDGSSGGPLSLLRLFIQHRGSSVDGESMCSSQSEASSSHQQQSECTVMNNANVEKKTLDDEERNNNNVIPTDRLDNLNIIGVGVTKPGEFNSESEEDSSQCFEDSLMEAHMPRNIALQASVIKEEDEPTENSSSDETMQDMKDPFLTDSGTSEEATITKNNSLTGIIKPVRRVDRITNVFPTGKSNQQINIACCGTMDDKLLPVKHLVPAIQTQGTQTKIVNQRKSSASPVTDSPDTSSSVMLEVDSSSVDTATSSTSPCKKLNVLIATTRTCGTQIPVHIKDQEAQTSVLAEDNSSEGWSFTLKESFDSEDLLDEPSTNITTCSSPIHRPQSPCPPVENKEQKNLFENKEKDELELEDDDVEDKPPEKSIYVCYPNYSLPDLSFLRAMTASPEKDGTVILNPTSRRQPIKQPAQRRSYSSEGREAPRPKSCDDFDPLNNFGHIRDWDSLKVLLPADIRNMISTMRDSGGSQSSAGKSRCGHRHHHRHKRSAESSPTNSALKMSPHFGVLKEIPPPIPKRSLSLPTTENPGHPRSILRKSSSSGQCNAANGLPVKCRSGPMTPWVEDAKSKRRSLQEPFHCLLDNIPEAMHTSQLLTTQPLYAMESSRIQEGGEEQPAASPFKQQRSSSTTCFSNQTPSKPNYSLSRTRSDGCCNAYRSSVQSDSDSSEDSDLQKLLVSSAALNYADALLAGGGQPPTTEQFVEIGTDPGYHRCNCSRGKKSVSFCETVNIGHHHHHHQQYSEDCVTSPCQCSSPDLIEEILNNSCVRSAKSGLLKRLQMAVQVVLDALHDIVDFDPKDKFSLENVVLNNICPALHTVMADGLLPSVSGLFGPLHNSPWRLAENSTQQDQKIQELVELVEYINGEATLCNNSTKFCAFVFGLLNLNMIDQWFAKFLNCSSLIHQNYQPNALVFLLSAVPSFVTWQRDILSVLKTLGDIPFQLDVLSPATAVATPPKQRPFSCIETSSVGNHDDPKIPSSTSWDENLNEQPPKRGDSPGFQELRRKWEKMANVEQPVAMTTAPVAMATKPPLPVGGGRTPREVSKKVTGLVKGSPVHMRSKLPSPVRSNTPPIRPHTPESPRHSIKSSPGGVARGNQGGVNSKVAAPGPRKSMIPVHRPPSARTTATGLGKRQPVVAKHPPNGRN